MKKGILDRIEKLMVKEDETQVGKLETPIQSTGSTPEAKDNKDVKPEAEKKEENKDMNHADFMKEVKPVMDKVKAKQIVTWQELEKLQQAFDKIKEVKTEGVMNEMESIYCKNIDWNAANRKFAGKKGEVAKGKCDFYAHPGNYKEHGFTDKERNSLMNKKRIGKKCPQCGGELEWGHS